MVDLPAFEHKKSIDERIMNLDQDIRRFRIDFERFFSGNLPIPPDQRRVMITNQIKDLRTERLRTVAHRFRFNTLEAKFNALLVLFNRRLREAELGRKARRAAEAIESELDPMTGIVIGDQASDAAAQALFQGLYADRSGGPKADFGKFQTYLAKQAEKIRDKTGCQDVSFRVTSEKGKMKLKAKAVKTPES